MNKDNQSDLERTEELVQFLQGIIPEGYKLEPSHIPHLTAEQAWTVIWYLGNRYWQVTDYIERCDVCGSLFNSNAEGTCLDYGDFPYHFCDSCRYTEEYEAKLAARREGE